MPNGSGAQDRLPLYQSVRAFRRMAAIGASSSLPRVPAKSLHRTHNGRSTLAAGTALDAPQQSFLRPATAAPVRWKRTSGRGTKIKLFCNEENTNDYQLVGRF